jgi:hypothetical protein
MGPNPVLPGGELDYLGRTITNLELEGLEIRDVGRRREHYQRTTLPPTRAGWYRVASAFEN